MINSVLNSAFEVALRLLLLLHIANDALTSDKLAAVDFIAVYGREFDVTEGNLHGDNNYMYGEFGLRREMTAEALKELVLKGLVCATATSGGIVYSATGAGRRYANGLKTDYAEKYRLAVGLTLDAVGTKDERELTSLINRRLLRAVRKGA